ncbi:hypothetical protein R3W88_017696 [Solanum pinnatisectum]|uniref:VQ domain-containing protein n=1 Tax=Solanum pinnatisectum TaxID=50273 RepID=A0AAV9L1U9_9SOLN|nr:hypothetical protein R3W88_017696 [Solanum pinnatisectum]
MNHAQFYRHSKTNDAMVMNNNNSNNNNNISSPLKINKASHHIKKLSNSLPSSSSSSSLYNAIAATTSTTFIPHHQQQRQPVIIYTHSPKVIHTHPRDFKALVQKLTGLSPEEVSSHSHPPQSMPMPQYHPKSEPINEEMDHDHDPISGAESCFGDLQLGHEENNYHRTNMTNINTNINEKCDLLMNDDNDSVVTDENNENNGSSCIGDNSSASCYVPPPQIFDLPNINDYKDINSDFSNYNYNNNINNLSDSPSFFDNNFAPFDPNPITNSSDYFFSDQQFCNYTDSLFFMPSMRNSFSSSSSESIKELPDF